METQNNLICHGHPLTLSSGFAFRCYRCKTGGYIINGYHCTTCDRWFHKDCVNDKFPSKIRHTSHPEHFLSKLVSEFQSGNIWCTKCTKFITKVDYYYCLECYDNNLHMSCAIEPPPHTITLPLADEHPLVLYPVSRHPEHLCKACKNIVFGKLSYRCFPCNAVFHVECISSPEINHPYHPKHSLKLLTCGPPDYADNKCLLCDSILKSIFYHCSKCNFSVCLVCASIPPPNEVENPKTHEHILTLIARQITFTCNACGKQGSCSPYFCLQCDFMIHRSCIGFPRVININHHDHRISHTQQLNFGFTPKCKVCFQNVNRFYGAYTCSICFNYVVHLQCATHEDFWDGIELEMIPEETKDITPFKKVGDNLINHFSHAKHNLKFYKDRSTDDASICCEACILPVYYDLIYSCEQCNFILHETCTNLPRRKHLIFHNKSFTLHVEDIDSDKLFCCSACGEYFSGFRYESDQVMVDIRCIFTAGFFYQTENHEHPLYHNKTYVGKCDACQREVNLWAFSCVSCHYNLDYRCASLPKIVKHIHDQHPLFLSSNEHASGKYWCDICEEDINPNIWFYICNDCMVALHVKCVFGDFSRLMPGRIFTFFGRKFVVVPNNHCSRPICKICGNRCKALLISKFYSHDNAFCCSHKCLNVLSSYMTMYQIYTSRLL